MLKHIIEPAATNCGYIAIRSDRIAEPGNITSQVIQHVLNDPMVIADLTGSNGNVFYELALRHAVKKPFIQLISQGETIPFDISGMRTIFLNHHDLDSAEEAREEIEKQIRAVENKPPEEIETPITVALDFQALRQSGNPEQRSFAEVFSALQEIRTSVARLEQQFDPYRSDMIHAVLHKYLRDINEAQDARFFYRVQDLVRDSLKGDVDQQKPPTG